jgi:hypothetical protein
MKKISILLSIIFLITSHIFGQQKQILTEVGIEFDCSLQLKKIADNPATTYTPKMKTFDGLSENGKPYMSVSLNVEEYATTKTEKSIVEMIKVMLSPAMTTQLKNGVTFYIDNRKSAPNDDTYYLQFVKGNVKYSFTIAGKTGTKAELEKIMNSISFIKK